MPKSILNSNNISVNNIHLGEGGGGTSFDEVLTAGQISTTSSYATASFSDVSADEFIVVRVYDTFNGVDYEDFAIFKPSKLTSEVTFQVTLHVSVTVRITTTTIRSTNYSGSFVNIYADIIGTQEDLFV